jgi:hypothetical protein
MKNTNQQDINDPHKVMRLAKEEWDQTDTWLAKYSQNSEWSLQHKEQVQKEVFTKSKDFPSDFG